MCEWGGVLINLSKFFGSSTSDWLGGDGKVIKKPIVSRMIAPIGSPDLSTGGVTETGLGLIRVYIYGVVGGGRRGEDKKYH